MRRNRLVVVPPFFNHTLISGSASSIISRLDSKSSRAARSDRHRQYFHYRAKGAIGWDILPEAAT